MQHTSDPDQRSGKRKSIGKRKLSDQGEPSQQRTISDLLQKNKPHESLQPPSSPLSKRSRRSVSPSHASTEVVPPNKMYNFSGSPPKGSSSNRTVPTPSPRKPQPFSASTPRQNTFGSNSGAKRLVVKNLRTEPRQNHGPYFEKIWARLDEALTEIFDAKRPTISLEELYKGAENLCRQEHASQLAQKVQQRCKDYVSNNLRNLLVTRTAGVTDVDTLRAVTQAWNGWHSKLIIIRWVFYYLDQSFLLHTNDFPGLHEMGLIQFRSHVFADDSLKPKILQGACDLIDADRGAKDRIVHDTPLLRSAIDLFHDLDVYSSDFEPLFIANTEIFVRAWAAEKSERSLETYVADSHQLISQEVQRCSFFSLNRSTKQKLSDLLDEVLITDNQDVLLKEKGVIFLIDQSSDSDSLQKLYRLLARRDLGDKLKPSFRKYIIERGTDIVFDDDPSANMVNRLLTFKKHLDHAVSHAFGGDIELGHALRDAFGHFMNLGKKSEATGGTDNPKTGEMIAKHVDHLLRHGLKAITPREPEIPLADSFTTMRQQLDQVLDLFRFVQGKAVFEAFYKNDLARRLLLNRSASDEAEKEMLVLLKKECGSTFTHNLEQMFKDMDVARDEMIAYKAMQKSLEHGKRSALDLNVNVLSSSSWPTYPDDTVQMPPVIMDALRTFETFYKNKHTGRKLMWKHQLAHCQIRARFPKGNKELVVSSFQAVVLLLFNDLDEGESLSYSAIQQSTGLSDPELERTLQSLACARYRVLAKKPKGKEVTKTDEFSYNPSFSDEKMRIKINQIQLKESKEENKTTHERVAADRHYETQAAIVRIMKSRGTVKHAELIAAVIEATRSRGTLQPVDIKKNIEKLIEKDYIERGDEGQNSYRYVA